jgi:hypothetical protein
MKKFIDDKVDFKLLVYNLLSDWKFVWGLTFIIGFTFDQSAFFTIMSASLTSLIAFVVINKIRGGGSHD